MKKGTISSKSFIRRCIVLSAAFLMIVFPSASVAAQGRLSDDPNFLMSNDILFYDPSSQACVSSGVMYSTRLDIPTLEGATNEEKVWNFLIDSKYGDLTKEQAAGVMGNIKQESNFDPTIEEGPSSAAKHNTRPVGLGIIQWSGTRRLELEDAAKEKGIEPTNLGFQLAYLLQEIDSSTILQWTVDRSDHKESFGKVGDNILEKLKEQETVRDAALFFHNSFERSGDTEAELNSGRLAQADKIYTEFSGGGNSGGGGGGGSSSFGDSSSSGCAQFAGGDLIQTLLAYAHPTYSTGQYPLDPAPKPAYLEAATRLEGEGKWVGGGTQEIGVAGIDCGGFVSLLLTQSGFEPDYNFGLDHSRGASNQEYGQQPWAEKYWTKLGQGNDISVSDLRPGDVAYSMGHTFIFVGQVDGFDSQYASASYSYSGKTAGKYPQADSAGNVISWRVPMAAGDWNGGGESVTSSLYTWYGRREGSPQPYGSTSINASWDGR